MLYNTPVAEQLYGGYYDHSRRAIWLGKQVRLPATLHWIMWIASAAELCAGYKRRRSKTCMPNLPQMGLCLH